MGVVEDALISAGRGEGEGVGVAFFRHIFLQLQVRGKG